MKQIYHAVISHIPFSQGNVPWRHLLNAKPLLISWRRSTFNVVNKSAQSNRSIADVLLFIGSEIYHFSKLHITFQIWTFKWPSACLIFVGLVLIVYRDFSVTVSTLAFKFWEHTFILRAHLLSILPVKFKLRKLDKYVVVLMLRGIGTGEAASSPEIRGWQIFGEKMQKN